MAASTNRVVFRTLENIYNSTFWQKQLTNLTIQCLESTKGSQYLNKPAAESCRFI